jgi:aspartyl-tRNA(Asn)/glutamyl-tRNA(Gln) amidotransferase subunit B
MAWEVVIGLETHAQLSTQSKIFSGSSTAFGASPNSQASAVDIALPGVLPVLNRGAVERAIRFGLAVGATIAPRSIFARKNYFYPDLPKGYQISQYELPVVQGGSLTIMVGDTEKTVRLTRAHLEEDAGKSIHGSAISGVVGQAVAGLAVVGNPIVNEDRDLSRLSGIDLNRAGTPLLEIVTEPDLTSAEEAVAYAKSLHALVQWIGICDGNMQEGSFRCDANVSVRRTGEPLGTRCEIKNLNSFNFMDKAIKYEVRRQIELIEDGGKVVQETRLYDPDKDETRSMRSKEDAMDYRYFPDPDLLPLVISEEWRDEVKQDIGELPNERKQRYIDNYHLPMSDASALVADRDIGNYFEGVVLWSLKNGEPLANADFKLCANWVINKVLAKMNDENLPPWKFWVSSDTLGLLLRKFREGTISAKNAEDLLSEFWNQAKVSRYAYQGGSLDQVEERVTTLNPLKLLESTFQGVREGAIALNIAKSQTAEFWVEANTAVTQGNSTTIIPGTGSISFDALQVTLDKAIADRGLQQISDSGEIEKIVDQVIAANAKSVEEFRAGKEKAFNALVGQVMKASKGKANPAQVNDLLKKKLAG